MRLPDKLKAFKPYPAMSGAPPVRLDGNESCFALPPAILDEISEELRKIDLHRYPDPRASEVCNLADEFWNAPTDSAVAGNGSDELISLTLSAFLSHGSKLVVADPDFSMYRFYATLCEVECLGIDRLSGLPRVDEIIDKGRLADAVIFSNPCNPTGQALSRADVLRIVESLDCPVLLDEAYADLWDGGRGSALEFVDVHNHLIVFKTCSKNLALAGIRLGFAFAGPKLRNVLLSVKSPYNVNSMTQAVGAIALSHPDLLRENTQSLVAAKDRLYARLSEWSRGQKTILVTDTVANFILLTMPGAEQVYEHLITQGISVRLIADSLRITAGTDQEQDLLLEALSTVSPTN